MDFLSIATSRYSVRSYTDKKVESEKLDKILLAAQMAPTAANLQPFKLIVIQNEEGLKKIGRAVNIFGAPLAIIVCSNHSKAWTRPFDGKSSSDIDAAIITDHMMLEATDLGLGAVWVCYFKPDVIRSEFALPDELEPVNILLIGYAKNAAPVLQAADKNRLPLQELVCYEELGKTSR